MIWRRRSPEQRAMTPADAADLAAARRAREQVERHLQSGLSRWPTILATVAKLREIRAENHLAEDLQAIFTNHRRG